MKTKKTNRRLDQALLPVGDFKLAIAYTTVWMLAFWVVEYPIGDWAVTAVVLYVSLWIAREVVSALILFSEMRLQKYARKAGVEPRVDPPAEYSFRDRLFLAVSFLLACFTIIGLSLIAGIPAVSLYGLTPLPAFFNWIAWGLFLVGGVGISLILGIVIWLLSSADAEIDATIVSTPAAVNRKPTELELRLLFLYLLLLYSFHLQFGRRQP